MQELVQNSHDQLQPFVIQEPFKLGTVIAAGSYGAVYSSMIGDILDILVGRGGHEGVSEKYKSTILSNFQRECTILSTARHRNVVQFIGVHYGSDQYDIRLIMEHLPTDLEKLLAYCEENEHGFKLPLSFQVPFCLTFLPACYIFTVSQLSIAILIQGTFSSLPTCKLK